jgi:hypothetical protein
MIEAISESLDEKVSILWRLDFLSDPIGLVHNTGNMISTDVEIGSVHLVLKGLNVALF